MLRAIRQLLSHHGAALRLLMVLAALVPTAEAMACPFEARATANEATSTVTAPLSADEDADTGACVHCGCHHIQALEPRSGDSAEPVTFTAGQQPCPTTTGLHSTEPIGPERPPRA